MTDYEKRMVDKITSRYCMSNGKINHHGDCYIHSTMPVCTCGLMHDLMPISHVAKDLYPDYEKDVEKERLTWSILMNTDYGEAAKKYPPMTPEQKKEADELLFKIFGFKPKESDNKT